MKQQVLQGEIWMVNLYDGIDHEQSGSRPALIASCNVRNEHSDNVFIFPITHATKKKQPCHYTLLQSEYIFFTYDTNTVLCEEGRSLSKKRLNRKIGQISQFDFDEIMKCKEFVFVTKDY